LPVSENRYGNPVGDALTFEFPLSTTPIRAKKKVSGWSFTKSSNWLTNLVQKCDAKRPCTTCTRADSTSKCIYNDEDTELEGTVPLFGTNNSITLGQRTESVDPVEVPTTTSTYPLAPLDPTPSTDTTRVVTDGPPDLGVFAVDGVPHGPSSGLVLVCRNKFGQRISLDSNPSISIASFFIPPTIPPEPWISLSSVGEEKLQVQVSETDVTDLDLRLCVLDWRRSVTNLPSDISRLWVLPRLLKLGVQLSPKRLDAFIRGDQSGVVLDRVFVCGAQVLGMGFSPDVGVSPAMVQHYARRSQIAWECLVELLKGKNYGVTVQGVMMVVASYILMRMTRMGIFYIQKSYDAINAGNLQFVPKGGPPPEFSEDLHEILVALSQTIYWSNYLFLTHGGPEPRATARLEKEFRQELPVGDITSTLSHIRLILYYSKLIRSSSKSVP